MIESTEHEVNELYDELYDPATPEQKTKIAAELADVFIFLLGIANYYNIDAETAIEQKIIRNEERFPVSLFDGTNGKTYQENYETAKRLTGEWDPRKHVLQPRSYPPAEQEPEDYFNPLDP